MWPQPPGLFTPFSLFFAVMFVGISWGLRLLVSVHSALQQVPVTTLSADKAFYKLLMGAV